MNSKQCRAARGLLKWSQQQLAEKARVGLSTVVDFENGKREPRLDNLQAVQSALEVAGVDFIAAQRGKGVGVRLRTD